MIINNLVADARRYDGKVRFRQELKSHYGQTQEIVKDDIDFPQCVYQQAGVWTKELYCLYNPREHALFSSALVYNVWILAGDEYDEKEKRLKAHTLQE